MGQPLVSICKTSILTKFGTHGIGGLHRRSILRNWLGLIQRHTRLDGLFYSVILTDKSILLKTYLRSYSRVYKSGWTLRRGICVTIRARFFIICHTRSSVDCGWTMRLHGESIGSNIYPTNCYGLRKGKWLLTFGTLLPSLDRLSIVPHANI